MLVTPFTLTGSGTVTKFKTAITGWAVRAITAGTVTITIAGDELLDLSLPGGAHVGEDYGEHPISVRDPVVVTITGGIKITLRGA